MRLQMFLAVLLIMVGCTSTAPVNKVVIERDDPLIQKISDLAKLSAQLNAQLVDIEKARYRKSTGGDFESQDISDLPILKQSLDLGANYSGRLKSLLTQLSIQAGMNEPRFLGHPPASGVFISLGSDFRTLYDLLKDIGYQADYIANVIYKVEENLLEVQYKRVHEKW